MRKNWSRFAVLSTLSVAALVACGGGDDEPTPVGLSIERIGGYTSPLGKTVNPAGNQTAQEIPAFDSLTKRAFIVNAALSTVDVLDLSDPSKPTLAGVIDVSSLGGSANSSDSSVSTRPSPVAPAHSQRAHTPFSSSVQSPAPT